MVLSVLLVVAIVGFVFTFTNGLNEDLKTFYVERNGKLIVAADSQTSFDTESENRFDCKYMSQPDEDNLFTVKVVPNVTDKTDFDYTVDGISYKWSETNDLTACFDIDKQKDYFIISFPADFSIETVLRSLYPDKEVIIPDTLSFSEYYYTLQISNYNDSITYCIDFNILGVTRSYDITFVVDGTTVKTERVLENSTITPPETPYKNGYVFNGWVDTNNSVTDFETYTACKDMTFTASFTLMSVNVAFGFDYQSSSSSGSGSGSSFSATPFFGGIDSSYGSFSVDAVSLSVESPTATVTFTLNSGYTYYNYSVSGGSSAVPFATSSDSELPPFNVSVDGNTVTLTLGSLSSWISNYTLSVIVTGSGSSSSGSISF